MTKEKQPYPNHNWCVGCTPDSCSGCGTEPADRRKPAVEVEPVALVSGYYGGRSVYQPLVNWILPVGTALYTHSPDSAATIAELEAEVRILKETKENIWSALKAKEAENAALKAELDHRTTMGGNEPPDLELIRNSPRQFVDMETVESLADYALCLELKVESLKADAERYRWLRNYPGYRDIYDDRFSIPKGKRLDCVIDAAIGAK